MKKITQLCLAFVGVAALATQASAQITITQADMPTAGLKALVVMDSTTSYAPGSPSATPQTWNFTTVKVQKTSTKIFMNTSASPYASKFSLSNTCDSSTGAVGYDFFDITSSQFAVEGVEEIVTDKTYGVSFQIFINLNPEFKQTSLPGTYGTIDGGVAAGKDEFVPASPVSLFYDSILVKTQISYWDTVDAFGTLNTPTGSYQVLRQNHREIDIDSAKGRSTSGSWSTLEATKTYYHQYNWFTNGVGYILVQMNMDTTSATEHDIMWDSTAPTGMYEISNSSRVSAFPNPCTSQITFNTIGNETQYLNIFDVTGRKVEVTEVKNNVNVLNTNAYAAGMYIYTLTDANGNVLDHGKFMVK